MNVENMRAYNILLNVIRSTVVLLYCFRSGSLNIVISPSNVAVLRGKAVELTCRTDSGSLATHSWIFTSAGSNKEISIYNRDVPEVNRMSSFQKSKDVDGYLNIKTESANLEDAGVYTCNIRVKEAIGNSVIERSAQLIVLDSEPKCIVTNHTVGGRAVQQLSCSVGYRGNWAPVMEWRKLGTDGQIITTGVQSHTTKDIVTSNLTVDIDSTIEGGLQYTCRTFFSAYTGNVNMTAENIPQYFYVWPVLLKPEKTEIQSPVNTVVTQGFPFSVVCKEIWKSTVYNWTFIEAGSSMGIALYTQGKSIDDESLARFKTEQIFRYSRLSTVSTRLTDAGTYMCTKTTTPSFSSNDIQESAQLIVLESDPTCSEKDTFEVIKGRREQVFYLRCSIGFRGNWAPLMEWRLKEGIADVIEHGVSHTTFPNQNVTSTLRLMASSTRQNAVYTCRTFFGCKNNNIRSSANNTPDYNKYWTSPVINKTNDVSPVTLIVSLSVVIIAILVALIVYHIFLKKVITGRHLQPSLAMTSYLEPVQESEYAAVWEIGEPTHYQQIGAEESTTNQTSPSISYSALRNRDQQMSQIYRKLPTNLLASIVEEVPQDLNTGGYIEFPVMDVVSINSGSTSHSDYTRPEINVS